MRYYRSWSAKDLRHESYFTKINLGLLRRYYVEGAYRRDQGKVSGSSASWSVGGSWRLDQEGFFPAGRVQEIRLYTTYGKSETIYELLPALSSFTPTRRPFTAGLSFSLRKNRLQGSLEYYSTEVKDLTKTNAYFPGSELPVGKQINSGMELSLTSMLTQNKRFSWSLTGHLTFQNDIVAEMPAKQTQIPDGDFLILEGASRYTYYTRNFYGVDPETGLVLYQGVEKYDPADPDIQILETAGRRDTVTSNFMIARKMLVGKSALPRGYGSMINSLRYRNFDLNLLITFQFGGWVMDNRYMNAGLWGTNFHRDLLKAWQKPGDMTDVPRLDMANSQFTAPSTRWLIRSDYVNLAGVKLSYRIPEKALSFMKVTIFANAENVYFLTYRKGMNTLNFLAYSADSYTYNFARKFNVGLSLKL